MDTKRLSRVEIKDADRGEFDCVFATLNVIDHDKDVTLPGAFDDGATVAVSAWGHQSWGAKLPVGLATIKETSTEAVASGRFFMDIPEAHSTFVTVKRLHEAGLGEWSYGYDTLDHSFGDFKGQRVRFLRKQAVHEISPLLQGAGINTRTLAAKSGNRDQSGRSSVTAYKSIRPHEADVLNRPWLATSVLAELAADASVADLRSMAACVDTTADPEAKSAYGFWHHHGPNAAANVRACAIAIAQLNGARGGPDIPEAERKGIYDHLAAHLREADREPPALRTDAAGGLKFNEEGIVVLADVSSYLHRAAEVMALRATKGKGLAPASAELLDWLGDDLRALKALLTTADDDDAARVFMRFVASKQR